MNSRNINETDGKWQLTLYEGPLPRGMSTHEAKQYAHDRFFGPIIDAVKDAQKAMDDDAVVVAKSLLSEIRVRLELRS